MMLACVLLCAIAMHAQEPYAVLNDDKTVLTFYYDKQKAKRGGMSVGPFTRRSVYNWNYNAYTITTVVFDASFASCTSLTSTSEWFYGCTNLTTIKGIENLKTDNVTDMSYMFYKCSGLTSLDVSGFKTDNVTDMEALFSGCSGLTSLDVSGFKTDNVTNMEDMFYKCSGLTSLDVSGFNTGNVTEMSGMFHNLRSLTNLDLSGFKTDKVEEMHEMFEDCESLTTLDLSGFNTDNVTGMGEMFNQCESLTTLDLSGFKTDNVTVMGQMFRDCESLKTIYVSNLWSTEKAMDGSTNMFTNCTELVGGQGTTYDSSHTDCSYARIDGGADAPGYFTYKASIPTVISRLNANTESDDDKAPVYNFSGRRVENTGKGIFIKNGEKFINR